MSQISRRKKYLTLSSPVVLASIQFLIYYYVWSRDGASGNSYYSAASSHVTGL